MTAARRIDLEVRTLPAAWCADGYMPEAVEETALAKIYRHPLSRVALQRAGEEALLEEMDRTGIDLAVVRALAWRDPERCRTHNRYLADLVRRHPDRFLAIGILPPPRDVAPRDAVREMIEELGLTGIELIPSWQGYKLDDALVEPALAEAERLGVPAAVEVDHITRSPDRADTAHSALVVAERHPAVKMIVAHLGGLLCLYGLNDDVRPKLANMMFVTSVPRTPRWVWYAVDAIGPRQIAFGSDFPFNVSSTQSHLIGEIEALPLAAADRSLVLGGNAARFLGLDADVAKSP